MIAPIRELEQALAKLPGFGRRSALRAALALVRESARLADPLAAALAAARESVVCCSRCGAFTLIGENPRDSRSAVMRSLNLFIFRLLAEE